MFITITPIVRIIYVLGVTNYLFSNKNFPMKSLNVLNDSVHILWFPKTLSQDQIGHECKGSNACTVIVLLLASMWNETGIRIELHEGCIRFDELDMAVLQSAILRGNKMHQNFIRNNELKLINLTIPESIAAIGSEMWNMFEWHSGIIFMDLGDTLHESLRKGFSTWEGIKPRCKPTLFVILTAQNNSVLFIYQEEPRKVILIDTHSHKDKGGVIACAPQYELRALCHWYHTLLRNCFSAQPTYYELSFFYFNK